MSSSSGTKSLISGAIIGVRPMPPPTKRARPVHPTIASPVPCRYRAAHRRAVFGRWRSRNLELARQIAEFGVEARPLAQQFGPGARVGDFVGRGASILVR
jgi:hypothetical protein